MTITVGVDTYATVAEADVYASARLWTAWAALTDAQKEARLVEAARYLDTTYSWKGRIADEAQALAWPRQNFADLEGRNYSTSTTLPQIKWAQIELANMATSSLVASDTQGAVSQVSAGSVSLTFKDGQQASETARMRPIDRILSGLFTARAGGSTVRINRV